MCCICLCFEQDVEDWDDVGLNMPKPPSVIELFRELGSHDLPSICATTSDCQCQVNLNDDSSVAVVEQQKDIHRGLVCCV